MGISGYEGTFRRSAQEVLRVLRENTSQLLTILEVVIHDPLYQWSLSPLQVRQKQQKAAYSKGLDTFLTTKGSDAIEEKANFGRDAAERTLTRIKSKLQGYEDPAGEALGVEGHIELLINEAISPQNLSRMYCGWAPWL